MASKPLLLTIVFMVALSASPAFATDFVVGDDSGWRLDFNYANWAKGKKFFVGDTILFKYNVKFHNVFKVNQTAYEKCLVPPSSEALTSGKDKISLSRPGKKRFICGVGNHCKNGMKLEINVHTYT